MTARTALNARREARRPVVRLAEDADQALLVDRALVLRQVFAGPLRGILIQGAVLFAVRVEVRPEVADWGRLRLFRCRVGNDALFFETPTGRPPLGRRLTRPS